MHRRTARHHVEAHLACAARMGAQPGRGRPGESRLLAAVHRQLRAAEGSGASRLHLHEGDEPSALHDEVDLDTPHPDVAFDDAIPSPRQEARGTLLAFRAEGAAVVTALHLLGSAGPGD